MKEGESGLETTVMPSFTNEICFYLMKRSSRNLHLCKALCTLCKAFAAYPAEGLLIWKRKSFLQVVNGQTELKYLIKKLIRSVNIVNRTVNL